MHTAVDHHAQYQTKFPTFDSEHEINHHNVTEETFPIWNADKKKYKSGAVGLHEEIIDFYNYIYPTAEEYWVREIVIAKVKNIIFRLWSDCQIDVFGSFKNGLFLPTSDIDIVIFGRWESLPLRTLEDALRMSGHVSDIKVLSRATVPIVKLTDVDTGLHVDISFNMMNSVRAADMIREYIRYYPCLPHLVFVLKQFLVQRDLNEVWTGGISSYALILMCINFLQNTLKKFVSINDVNLGTRLVEFFELYGRNFNYMTTAIRIRGGGAYVRKETIEQNMKPGCRPSILCIEDPLCPDNDVGRRSYAAVQVKQAFEHAYLVLCSALRPEGNHDNSILSQIIQISPAVEECRLRIRSHAQKLYCILPHMLMCKPLNQHQLTPPEPTYASKIDPAMQSSKSDQSIPGNKKRTIVSARGFSTPLPPFLRVPPNENMLTISTQFPPCLYPQHSVVYNANNMVPVIPFSANSKHVYIYLPPFRPPQTPIYPPVISPVDSESAAMSQSVPESDSEDNLMSDTDSYQQNNETLDDSHSSSPKNCDIQQQSLERNKSCRSSSAANPCSNLARRLAPLRLASSEQNVAYNQVAAASNNRKHSALHQESPPDQVPSGNNSVSGNEEPHGNLLHPHAREEPAQTASDSSKMHSKGRYRRRQRLLKPSRHQIVGFSSTEDSEAHTAVDPNTLNGISLKRRCSQLQEPSESMQQNRAAETASSSSHEKLTSPTPTVPSQKSRYSKSWFPVKESVCTVSYSSAKSDDQNSGSQVEPQTLLKSTSRRQKSSSKKVTAPPALKRLATG